MQRSRFLLIALAALAMSGCSAVDRLKSVGEAPKLTAIANPVTQPGYRPVSMPMPAPAPAVYNSNSLWRSGARAFFKDQRAAKVGDILTVTVSYSGGCEAHQFTLVASNVFLESYPVQLGASLAHDANGDSCERWVTEDWDFDLTPIKRMYQDAYREEAGTIVLRLEHAPEPGLVYEFML